MPQVLKRPQAEADLDDIWWYIAQENPDAADRLLDSIDERCATLAQFPSIGTSRDELLPNLRSLPVGNYLIFTCRFPMVSRSSECCPVCETLMPCSSHGNGPEETNDACSELHRDAGDHGDSWCVSI